MGNVSLSMLSICGLFVRSSTHEEGGQIFNYIVLTISLISITTHGEERGYKNLHTEREWKNVNLLSFSNFYKYVYIMEYRYKKGIIVFHLLYFSPNRYYLPIVRKGSALVVVVERFVSFSLSLVFSIFCCRVSFHSLSYYCKKGLYHLFASLITSERMPSGRHPFTT